MAKLSVLKSETESSQSDDQKKRRSSTVNQKKFRILNKDKFGSESDDGWLSDQYFTRASHQIANGKSPIDQKLQSMYKVVSKVLEGNDQQDLYVTEKAFTKSQWIDEPPSDFQGSQKTQSKLGRSVRSAKEQKQIDEEFEKTFRSSDFTNEQSRTKKTNPS